MLTVWHVVVYASAFVFLVAVVGRIVRIARMPVHLRWELYPVPHEKGKAEHGGSVLEEKDWWLTKREVDHWGDLKVMLAEILLLRGVWEHNRKLWFPSFALHFGLYLLIGNIALLIVAGLMETGGVQVGVAGAGQWLAALLVLIRVVGWAGFVLGTIGAILMLNRRLFDTDVRMYSTFSHYLNLVFLGAIYVSGLVLFASDPNAVPRLSVFYAGLLNGGHLPALTTAFAWHAGFVIAFMVYLPFTHMTHFFTKYFTYHTVRWEDTPNLPGGKLEGKIQDLVQQKVTWAGPHIQGNGNKTWVDVATSTGKEE